MASSKHGYTNSVRDDGPDGPEVPKTPFVNRDQSLRDATSFQHGCCDSFVYFECFVCFVYCDCFVYLVAYIALAAFVSFIRLRLLRPLTTATDRTALRPPP